MIPKVNIKSLPTDQEVPGSITGYTVKFFLESFYGMYRLTVVLSFAHVLPCVVFAEGLCIMLTTGLGRTSKCALYVVHRNIKILKLQ